MPLKILGLNHNTAPVEIREKVVFDGEAVAYALRDIRDIDGVEEAVLPPKFLRCIHHRSGR